MLNIFAVIIRSLLTVHHKLSHLKHNLYKQSTVIKHKANTAKVRQHYPHPRRILFQHVPPLEQKKTSTTTQKTPTRLTLSRFCTFCRYSDFEYSSLNSFLSLSLLTKIYFSPSYIFSNFYSLSTLTLFFGACWCFSELGFFFDDVSRIFCCVLFRIRQNARTSQ